METTSHAPGDARASSPFNRTVSFNSPQQRGADVSSLFSVDDCCTSAAATRAVTPMRTFFSGPLVLLPSRGDEHHHAVETPDTSCCCSNSSIASAEASRKLIEGVGGGEHLRKWSESEVGSSCRADASSFRSAYSEQEEERIESVQETQLEASTPGLEEGAGPEDHHQGFTCFHQSASAGNHHHHHHGELLEVLSQNGRPLLLKHNAAPEEAYMRRKCGGGDVKSWKQASTKCVDSGGDLNAASAPVSVVIEAGDPPATKLRSSRDEKLPAKIGNGSVRHHGFDNNRRPTASIAWDALNTSRENSPQHDLAAIPFRWEQAPGKPKTTLEQQSSGTAIEESQMMKQREGHQRNLLSSDGRETSTDQDCLTSSERLRELQPGRSHSTSFRSSHRFYAMTASSSEVAAADQNFGSSRSSIDIGHMISEVEAEAHIDLVAPAAAKFLVESCPLISSDDDNGVVGSSCTLEAEQSNLASIIPFKWEEAPGKPKHEELAKSSLRRMQSLQLPPRLLASPQRSDSIIYRQFELELELGQQHRTNKYVSMSGPLTGYYQRSSPAAELMNQRYFSAAMQCQQQHHRTLTTTRRSSKTSRSPTRRLHSSPSKRSISPSKIQALAKHLARKATAHGAAGAGIVPESDAEELNWLQTEYNMHHNTPRHSFTSGYTSGPLEGAYKGRNRHSNNDGGSKTLLLGRSSRPTTFTSEHQHRSGPLERTTAPLLLPPPLPGLKSQSRSKSPSMVSGRTATRSAVVVSPLRMAMSPSRIHALARQLTSLRRATSAPPPLDFALEDSALEDPNWPLQAKNVRQALSFTTPPPPSKPKGSSIGICSSESTGSEGWADRQQQQQQQQAGMIHEMWSPRSILHGPFHNPTSDPSSCASDRDTQTQTSAASDRDTHTQTSAASDRDSHSQTASNAALMNTLSQSLSCASYESFEHSFTDNVSATSSFPATTWDHASCSSPIGSPYLGPITTTVDHSAGKGAVATRGGASEGVRAIIKLCRTGSHHWRRPKHKHKIHNTEIWAPTLATAFQSGLDLNPMPQSDSSIGGNKSLAQHLALRNGANNKGIGACLDEHENSSSSPVESSSPEAQTRLPYTMPSVSEQDASCVVQDYGDSPNTQSATCLGVKLSPAKFIITSGETPTAWSNRGATTSSAAPLHHPTSNPEDGYRSPAYTATLELLSPASDLISKKRKKELAKSHSIRLRMPSRKIRRKTTLFERIYKSLKRAIRKCIRHCYPKSGRLHQHPANVVRSTTEFSFCKPI